MPPTWLLRTDPTPLTLTLTHTSTPHCTYTLQVGKYARVGTMMAKDSVRTRMESEQGISFTEFTYQLLQVGRGNRRQCSLCSL